MRDSTLKYKEQYEKRMENYNSRGMKEEPKPKGLVDRMKGKEDKIMKKIVTTSM